MRILVYQWIDGECRVEVSGTPELCATGKSDEEALGKLIKAHPQLFLVAEIKEVPKAA
jgi:hypothetical protein